MVLGRGAPSGTGVVDQDVDRAHPLGGFNGQATDVFFLAAVGSNPAGIDARGLQLGRSDFQVGSLARAEHDLGPGFSQRMGHLQAQSARAARDQGNLPGEVKQLLNSACHGGAPLFDSEIHAVAFVDNRFHERFDGQMLRVILVGR